jgi:hypothetical protein
MAGFLLRVADQRTLRLWDVVPVDSVLARLTLDQGVPAVSNSYALIELCLSCRTLFY